MDKTSKNAERTRALKSFDANYFVIDHEGHP
jgi:hypothetical protein